MKMSNTVEHWASDVFTDVATGGKLDMFRGIYHLVIKVCSGIGFTFLNRKIGTRAVNRGTLFWGLSFIGSLMLISGASYDALSTFYFFWLWVVFILFGLYRIIESHINLRRSKGSARHGVDPGQSIIWEFGGKWLFEQINLSTKKGKERRWFHMDDLEFQRFVQPFIIMGIGTYFYSLGAIIFGKFIVFSGICYFLYLRYLVRNYYKQLQAIIDGQVMSGAINHNVDNQPSTQAQNHQPVITAMPARSRADFEAWQQSRIPHPSKETLKV